MEYDADDDFDERLSNRYCLVFENRLISRAIEPMAQKGCKYTCALKPRSHQHFGKALPRTGILAEAEKEFSGLEKKVIEAALAECHGRIAGPRGAAAKLGVPPQTLDSKIASLGIDKRRFKAGLSR